MSITNRMLKMSGSCHCDALQVEFFTQRDPAKIHPRSCDCSFCCKHGAAYISDSAGTLSIQEKQANALRAYRQGSNAAQFLFCSYCGVLIGVVFSDHDGVYGAVNATCLDDAASLGDPVPASPQKLTPDEKILRWLQLWTPNVILATFAKSHDAVLPER